MNWFHLVSFHQNKCPATHKSGQKVAGAGVVKSPAEQPDFNRIGFW
jgi:hypothetical protein